MSNRIPINNFGQPILSKDESGLSKPKADYLYLNVSGGDGMASDLDMGGFQISNVDTPEQNKDAANKVYVDQLITVFNQKIAALTEQISELNRAQSIGQRQMMIIKLNLSDPFNQPVHQIDPNYFVVSVRLLARDGTWYDQHSNEGKKVKLNVFIKGDRLQINKETIFNVRSLTGSVEILLMKGNSTPLITSYVGVPSSRPTFDLLDIGVASST